MMLREVDVQQEEKDVLWFMVRWIERGEKTSAVLKKCWCSKTMRHYLMINHRWKIYLND